MDDFYDFRAPGEGAPYGPVDVSVRSCARMPMRSAYSRAGLSVLVCYGVASVVTVLLLAAAFLFFLVPEFWEWYQGLSETGPVPDLIQGIRNLLNGSLQNWLELLSVLGAGIGFGVSIPIIRKVLRYRSCTPVKKQPLSAPLFLLVILAAYGLWGVGVYAGNFIEFLGYSIGDASYMTPEPGKGILLSLLPLLYAVFGAPVLEELIFRKTLLNVLHPYGEKCAALVTALLFGLVHGNSGQFTLAFLLGLLFAAVYLKTGNILYTMVLHFIINLTASIPEFLLYFDIDIGEFFTYYLLAGLTVVGLVVLFCIRKKDLFKLTASAEEHSNRAMFRNPGMLIAVIAGSVSLVATDLMMIVSAVSAYQSAVPLLAVLSTCVTILIVVLVCTLGGRNRKNGTAPPAGDGRTPDDTPYNFT